MKLPVTRWDKAQLVTIQLRKNRRASGGFIFRDKNGDPIDMIAEYSAKFEFFLRESKSAKKDVLRLSTEEVGELEWEDSNSKLIVPLTPELTQLKESTYYYELLNIEEDQTWINGDAIIVEGKWSK